jgi:hypothetical protein
MIASAVHTDSAALSARAVQRALILGVCSWDRSVLLYGPGVMDEKGVVGEVRRDEKVAVVERV